MGRGRPTRSGGTSVSLVYFRPHYLNHQPSPRAPFAARAPQPIAKSPKKRLLVVGPEQELAAGPRSPAQSPRPFRHPVFATEAEYDRSVASVVARIQSGQVKARTPDE